VYVAVLLVYLDVDNLCRAVFIIKW